MEGIGSMIAALTLKIRRRETPFWQRVYDLAHSIRSMNFPCIRFIHCPLYHFVVLNMSIVRRMIAFLWLEPLFKSRLATCGRGLRLLGGLPEIAGDNLIIAVGDDVVFHNNTLSGGQTFLHPYIEIGNRTHLGHEVCISAAKAVYIGSDCTFASFAYIADNDGHEIDPVLRIQHQAVQAKHVIPVRIGKNVWVGTNAMVLKGTEIGDGSVIAAGVILSKQKIPSNSLVKRDGTIVSIINKSG